MTDIQRAAALTEQCQNATPEQVVERARELAEEWSNIERRGTLLLAELGVYHRRAADDPEVLKAAGCETLRDFEQTVLKAAHATIGLVSSSYKYFPELTPERFVSIGPVKMRRAIAAVKGKDMSAGQRESVLEMVLSADNVYHATKRLEDKVSGPGTLTKASLLIEGDAIDISELEQHLADERNQRGADTSDPCRMINQAFIEAGTEWNK